MDIHNSPQYIVSTLEDELKRLGVPPDFVKDLSVFHVDDGEDGYCHHIIKNKKLVGVRIGILEEKSQHKTKGKVFHEAKHAEQYYKRGYRDVEEINPVYNELEAFFYGYRRLLGEGIHYIGRKLKLDLIF